GVLVPGLAAVAAKPDDKKGKPVCIPNWHRKEFLRFSKRISSTELSKPDSSGSRPAMTCGWRDGWKEQIGANPSTVRQARP
ncbi:MAG: hypothetical protein AAGF82_22010, partial [Pseudomonadota bacterium]